MGRGGGGGGHGYAVFVLPVRAIHALIGVAAGVGHGGVFELVRQMRVGEACGAVFKLAACGVVFGGGYDVVFIVRPRLRQERVVFRAPVKHRTIGGQFFADDER